MKQYHICRMPAGTPGADIDWAPIPCAAIDTYRWFEAGTYYAPEAQAQCVYVPGDGFYLRMTCVEKQPKVTFYRYNDPVYTDSCMEFFADWLNDGRYINMEMNAAGTLLSCIGTGREDRRPITDFTDGEFFHIRGEKTPEAWTINAHITEDLLRRILGTEELPFRPGYTFRGNFYKCGDDTAVPHYGMWNPVETAQADFHRPEYFGTFVID